MTYDYQLFITSWYKYDTDKVVKNHAIHQLNCRFPHPFAQWNEYFLH